MKKRRKKKELSLVKSWVAYKSNKQEQEQKKELPKTKHIKEGKFNNNTTTTTYKLLINEEREKKVWYLDRPQ